MDFTDVRWTCSHKLALCPIGGGGKYLYLCRLEVAGESDDAVRIRGPQAVHHREVLPADDRQVEHRHQLRRLLADRRLPRRTRIRAVRTDALAALFNIYGKSQSNKDDFRNIAVWVVHIRIHVAELYHETVRRYLKRVVVVLVGREAELRGVLDSQPDAATCVNR